MLRVRNNLVLVKALEDQVKATPFFDDFLPKRAPFMGSETLLNAQPMLRGLALVMPHNSRPPDLDRLPWNM